MAICPKCGVEIGDASAACPLCGVRLSGGDQGTEHASGFLDRAASAQPESRTKRLVAVETAGVSFAIAAVSVLIIDLLTDGRVSWSLYPLASLLMAWMLMAPPLLWPRKPALFLALQGLSVFAFLFGLDLIDGSLGWSVALGAPITAAAELMILGAVLVSARAKRRGLNVLAFALIAVAGFCLALEGFVSLYARGVFRLTWSSITASAVIPVAAFLLYVHYRLAKDATLKKLFHL